MKRRRITIGGKSVSEIQRGRDEAKIKLAERFDADPTTLAKFVDYVINSGWDVNSIMSVAEQSTNFERPAVPAFLLNGGTVLDQIALNQGTYTDFQDTAQYPNFALRFPGETETMLRRLTPGDLMMLNAAHRLSALYPDLVDTDPRYWQEMWRSIYFSLYPQPLTLGRVLPHEQLHDDPWQACLMAYKFFLQEPEELDQYMSPMSQLTETFMRSRSRFFTGVSARHEHMRQLDAPRYDVVWTFERADNEEALWFTAVIITCYGVDSIARRITSQYTTLSPWFNFHDNYRAIVSRTAIPIPHVKCDFAPETINADTPQVITS